MFYTKLTAQKLDQVQDMLNLVEAYYKPKLSDLTAMIEKLDQRISTSSISLNLNEEEKAKLSYQERQEL